MSTHATIEINGERFELSSMLETGSDGTVTRHWFSPLPLPVNPPAVDPEPEPGVKPSWLLASVPYAGDGQ